MADTAVKQTAAKGAASAVDMAARPFRCEWHEGCSKVCDSSPSLHFDVEATLHDCMLTTMFDDRASIASPTSNVIIGYIPMSDRTRATTSPARRPSYSAVH
jgi:hypothetical protein